jgi:hypothetical protein
VVGLYRSRVSAHTSTTAATAERGLDAAATAAATSTASTATTTTTTAAAAVTAAHMPATIADMDKGSMLGLIAWFTRGTAKRASALHAFEVRRLLLALFYTAARACCHQCAVTVSWIESKQSVVRKLLCLGNTCTLAQSHRLTPVSARLCIYDCSQLHTQAHEKTRAAARKAMPAHYSAPLSSASRPGSVGAPSPTSSSGAPRTPRTLASYGAFGWHQQHQQQQERSSSSGGGIVDATSSAAKRHRHQSLLLAPTTTAAATAAATVKTGVGAKSTGSKSSSPVVMQTLASKRRSTVTGSSLGGAEIRGAKTLKPSLKAPTPPGSDEGVFERRVG